MSVGLPEVAILLMGATVVATQSLIMLSLNGVNFGHMRSVLPPLVWMITVWSRALAASCKITSPEVLQRLLETVHAWFRLGKG